MRAETATFRRSRHWILSETEPQRCQLPLRPPIPKLISFFVAERSHDSIKRGNKSYRAARPKRRKFLSLLAF